MADCGECRVCANGQCSGCPDCCDADGVCQDGDDDDACGSSGACDVCTGQDQCQNQQCVCVPDCTGKTCGDDGCGDACGPGCDACETCLGDGTCSAPCGGSGCCSGTTCELGTSDSACGRNGETCVPCSGTGVTCGGGGQDGVCGCTPDCTGKVCGSDGCGDSCGECGSGEGCLGGVCSPVRYVFASSTGFNGNLGGLNGADAKCLALAGQAGLPGAYKAWLSDDTGSPSTRFTQSTVPYVLVDDTVIANNWAGLTSGSLLHAIDRDENGAFVFSNVWSNTKPDGTLIDGSRDCDNWLNGTFTIGVGPVGRCGDSNDTISGWTQRNDGISCDVPERIYCFQQG